MFSLVGCIFKLKVKNRPYQIILDSFDFEWKGTVEGIKYVSKQLIQRIPVPDSFLGLVVILLTFIVQLVKFMYGLTKALFFSMLSFVIFQNICPPTSLEQEIGAGEADAQEEEGHSTQLSRENTYITNHSVTIHLCTTNKNGCKCIQHNCLFG